jgi:hypothetical protein
MNQPRHSAYLVDLPLQSLLTTLSILALQLRA